MKSLSYLFLNLSQRFFCLIWILFFLFIIVFHNLYEFFCKVNSNWISLNVGHLFDLFNLLVKFMLLLSFFENPLNSVILIILIFILRNIFCGRRRPSSLNKLRFWFKNFFIYRFSFKIWSDLFKLIFSFLISFGFIFLFDLISDFKGLRNGEIILWSLLLLIKIVIF